MNELLDILKEAMPKVDWENGEDLVDDGVIDSMDVVTIISEITDPIRRNGTGKLQFCKGNL